MTKSAKSKTAGVVPAFVPKAPDAIMAELWAFKRQANADAQYDVRKLLARIRRETELKIAETSRNA